MGANIGGSTSFVHSSATRAIASVQANACLEHVEPTFVATPWNFPADTVVKAKMRTFHPRAHPGGHRGRSTRVRVSASVVALALAFGTPHPARSQEEGMPHARSHRIWGEVVTREGERHIGFLRFTRGPVATWADVFRAQRVAPASHYRDWLNATQDGTEAIRSIDLKGYRITWGERHSDYPEYAVRKIRAGRIAALVAEEADFFNVIVRGADNDATLPWQARLAWPALSVEVTGTDNRPIRVRNSDVLRIDLFRAPRPAPDSQQPLYGTATTHTGFVFTGFSAWGSRTFATDLPVRTYRDGTRVTIPLNQIRSFERSEGNPAPTRLVTVLGDTIDGHQEARGRWTVRVSDPEIGRAEIGWEAFRSLRFMDAPPTDGYESFASGHPLFGTVVTNTGEKVEGNIRWDADREWSWDILSGNADGVDLDIELGNIRSIERMPSKPGASGGRRTLPKARITLVDGRSLSISGSRRTGLADRGVLVFPLATTMEVTASGQGASDPDVAHHVEWADIRSVHLSHPPPNGGSAR